MTVSQKIAAANALLEGTSISPITMPKPIVASTPKLTAKQASMSKLLPSAGQMRRINNLHERLGLRTYGPRQFKVVFPTMLDASNYYADANA